MTDRPDPYFDQHPPDLDPQLLEFARRFDPARHLPDPPQVTAEQLRRRADRRKELDRQWRAQPVPHPLRRLWLPAICVAAIIVLSMTGIAALRPHLTPTVTGSHQPTPAVPSQARPASPARPAPLELPAAGGGVRAAKQALNDLAEKAERQPAQTPAVFTYVRRQAWSAGLTVPPAVIATDIQTWLRADLSAYEQSTTLPPQPAGGRTTQWTQQLPVEIRATLQTYGAGGYPHPIPSPSPQAGILAAQIGNSYGYHVATGVADLFRLGLSPAQRGAALQVLAGTNNLAYHGTVTDRASRTGIAITSTDPGTGVREVLIFHPDTGELLGHERMATGAGGEILVDAYTLYLDTHTTNTRP